jgi:error-prone DNA polymerase
MMKRVSSDMLPLYAELHCCTNFSFLRGASHPEELVERAHALGYSALAITDECSLAGVVRAHVAAKECGLKIIIGAEFALRGKIREGERGKGDAPTPTLPLPEEGEVGANAPYPSLFPLPPSPPPSARVPTTLRVVLLATDREGYGNLSTLITRGRRNAAKGEYRLTCDDLADGVRGCLALLVPSPFSLPPSRREEVLAHARWLADTFPGRAWIAVESLADARDRAHLAQLVAIGRQTGLPLVAAGDVHMHVRGRRALQDVLTAIRLKTPVAEAGHALFPNGERHLRRREILAMLYPPELLAETFAIAERCTFSLDSLRYEYPEEIVPAGLTPIAYLRQLAYEGLRWRFAGGPPPDSAWEEDRKTREGGREKGDRCGAFAPTSPSSGRGRVGVGASPLSRPPSRASAPSPFSLSPSLHVPAHVRGLIDRELALIEELRYEPYFLTVYDVVKFARSRGILCQGRGSAANSAVCYCLGITEVDPSRMSMLFERFISRERNEPPDIDVDFEHERREEVIQHLYDKYGRDRAALAATVITYRPKSAVRDAGKALGLSLEQVDRLAKNMTWWEGNEVKRERLIESGFDPDNPVIVRLIAIVNVLLGFPRHLSQHVGGFVISRGPLSRLTPIENAAMPDRTVIQWDKDDLDALGLLKVDVLALGMLTAIRRALDLVSDYRGVPMCMQDVPTEDPRTYEMIQRGDTTGVFQIESRAQMAMLPRLKPENFYDLVIEVAIVRPGPIQGGMVHPYLRRRQKLEPATYPSAAVKQVLERTLGVPIFQEQVMQLAMVAAGFTPGQADQLRRSMAAWRRKGGLWKFQQALIDGMRTRGYTEEFAQQIFRQIQGFGEYGFPESHSASFALLVYVSAWLKCHEPAAFCAALLNSQPMGFYAPSQLVQDARRNGVRFRPVDVGYSDWDCTLKCGEDDEPEVWMGLILIRGLSEADARRVVAARQERAFRSVQEVAERARLTKRAVAALAEAGAFASLAGHRHAANWAAAGVEHLEGVLVGAGIEEDPIELSAPRESQELVADYRSLGLTLGRHPLALLRGRLARIGIITAEQIRGIAHGRIVKVAGVVTHRQRPATASGVVFATLEDETGTVNLVIWRKVLDAQRAAILGAKLMAVKGKVQSEQGVTHIIAYKVEDHSAMLGVLHAPSRDFH